ncbi:MAG TPA: outer membrane beta-barrel protein [Saprospiraceae bacterium]|nr:outer membrane beta-barrel protein [Saprospiraceae bacterium]
MIRLLIAACLILFVVHLDAQEYNIGIRAGQNYSKKLGPTEVGESIGFATGIHFALSFQYNIQSNFAVKSELLYIQNGYKLNFDGDSYYMIRKRNGGVKFEPGILEKSLDVSIASIQIPVMAIFRLSNKWEIFGGGYLGVIISPTARGNLRFQSTDHPEDIFFRQSLDYRYYNDLAGAVAGFGGGGRNAVILVDGVDEEVPRLIGAYYQYLDKSGTLFNAFDYGFTGGINYFLNRGFFIGYKIDYGMRDITNNRMHRSLVELNPDNSLKMRNDFERNFTMNFSFGFRF